MKKIISLFVLSITALFLVSCSNLFVNTGSVTVRLPGATDARNVATGKYDADDIAYYNITVSGPDFSDTRQAEPGTLVSFSDLNPGSYSVDVKAFTYKYLMGTQVYNSVTPFLAAFGEASAEVTAGETATANVPLYTIYPSTISRPNTQIKSISVSYKKPYEVIGIEASSFIKNCSAYVTYEDNKSVLFENLENMMSLIDFGDGNLSMVGDVHYSINWVNYVMTQANNGITENSDLEMPDLVVSQKYNPVKAGAYGSEIPVMEFPAYGSKTIENLAGLPEEELQVYGSLDYLILKTQYDYALSFSKPGLTAEPNEGFTSFIVTSSSNDPIETTLYIDVSPKANQYSAPFDKASLTTRFEIPLKVSPYYFELTKKDSDPVEIINDTDTLDPESTYKIKVKNDIDTSLGEYNYEWTFSPSDAPIEVFDESNYAVVSINADGLADKPSSTIIKCVITVGDNPITLIKNLNLPAKPSSSAPATFQSLESASLKQTDSNKEYVILSGAIDKYFVLASNSGGAALTTGDFTIMGKYSDNSVSEITDPDLLEKIAVRYPEGFSASNISMDMPITLSYDNGASTTQCNIIVTGKPQPPTINIVADSTITSFKCNITAADQTFVCYDNGSSQDISANKIFVKVGIYLEGNQTLCELSNTDIDDPTNFELNLTSFYHNFMTGASYTITVSAYASDNDDQYFYPNRAEDSIVINYN